MTKPIRGWMNFPDPWIFFPIEKWPKRDELVHCGDYQLVEVHKVAKPRARRKKNRK